MLQSQRGCRGSSKESMCVLAAVLVWGARCMCASIRVYRAGLYTHLPHFRPAIGIPPKCRCVWEFNVYLEWPPLLCNTVVMTDTPSPLSGDTDVKTQQKHSHNQPPTNTCRHTYAQQRIKTAVLNITRVRQRGLSINHPSHT